MNTDPDRCCGCGKILLHYPEPYLGDPAEIAAAVTRGDIPASHVTSQRAALIWCTKCQALNAAQTEALTRARRAGMCSETRGWGVSSSGAGYGNHREEYEDMETGVKGKL